MQDLQGGEGSGVSLLTGSVVAGWTGEEFDGSLILTLHGHALVPREGMEAIGERDAARVVAGALSAVQAVAVVQLEVLQILAWNTRTRRERGEGRSCA
ncbi:hypothetical protein ACOMHN_067344 [Nucella lapillus]